MTIGDETMPLPKPFLVLATQNPIEQEGTYPLPEAQVDRFLMKLKVGYPTKAEERQILDRMGDATEAARLGLRAARPLARPRSRGSRRSSASSTPTSGSGGTSSSSSRPPAIRGPTACRSSRTSSSTAPPRAPPSRSSRTARAHAFLQGRGYVVPEDVKEVAPDVLRHRVLLSYEAEAENVSSDQVVSRILERIEVP